MARRDRGAVWTEEHRLAQVRIGANSARDMLDLWRQVSPSQLRSSSTSWLRQALSGLRRRRQESRDLSAAYVRLLRAERTGSTFPDREPGPDRSEVTIGELRRDFSRLAHVSALPEPDDAERVHVEEDLDWPEVDVEVVERRATVGLMVTGPVSVQQQVDNLRGAKQRGRLDDVDFLAELDQVMRGAGVQVAGAASREALMGGRELLEDSSRADRQVIGWARVTDSDPCWFCAMLASRGAVYRDMWTARYRGKASRRKGPREAPPEGWADWSPERLAQWETERGLTRYHNHCHCTLVPVYSRTDWVPEASQAWRQLYYETTEGLTGPEARAAFRAAMEARRRRASARGVTVV